MSEKTYWKPGSGLEGGGYSGILYIELYISLVDFFCSKKYIEFFFFRIREFKFC